MNYSFNPLTTFLIKDALKREVKEESFLDVQPLSLLCVESESSYWFRFTFTAKSIGGTLKTPDQEDKESIEARWIPIKDVFSGEVNLRYALCYSID